MSAFLHMDSVVINTMTKNNLERKRFIPSHSLVPYPKKSEQGLEAGTKAEAMKKYCLLA